MSLFAAGNTPYLPGSRSLAVSIRQAGLLDAWEIGRLTAKVYHDTPLTTFLAPHREKYPAQYIREFQQRALARMLDPRFLSFVAVVPGKEEKGDLVVGQIQFYRQGCDEDAKMRIKQRCGVWLALSAWILWVWIMFWNLTVGDRVSDKARVAAFKKSQATGKENDYWAGMSNRWYAQSVVVDKRFQGKGVGNRLMGEMMIRAKAERTIATLESSPEGEMMYRSLGFKLLERFDPIMGLDDEFRTTRGGFMIWEPES